MTTQYRISATVIGVNFRRELISSHLTNPSDHNSPVIQKFADLGWFVHLSGSHESLLLGQEQPDLKPGDEVEIIIRRKPCVA